MMSRPGRCRRHGPPDSSASAPSRRGGFLAALSPRRLRAALARLGSARPSTSSANGHAARGAGARRPAPAARPGGRRLGAGFLALALLAAAALAAGTAPAQAQTTVWTSTLTVGLGTYDGYDAADGTGSLGTGTFTIDGTTYTVRRLGVDTAHDLQFVIATQSGTTFTTTRLSDSDNNELTLQIESSTTANDFTTNSFPLKDASSNANISYWWDESTEGAGSLIGHGTGATPTVRLIRADTTAPSVSTTTLPTVNKKSLVITFDEALDTGSVPAPGDFTVEYTPSGQSETTVDVATGGVSVTGSTVTLTLALALIGSDSGVKVSYAKPTGTGANPLRDAAENDVANFTDTAVTNNSPDCPTGQPSDAFYTACLTVTSGDVLGNRSAGTNFNITYDGTKTVDSITTAGSNQFSILFTTRFDTDAMKDVILRDRQHGFRFCGGHQNR